MTDLVVTWPKSRRLGSYISALAFAQQRRLNVNYRVRRAPDRKRLFEEGPQPPRLYRVHDGKVRGYTEIIAVGFREEGEVARVADDPLPGDWPAGTYIVCTPKYVDVDGPEMAGFRGFRWYDRTQAGQ